MNPLTLVAASEVIETGFCDDTFLDYAYSHSSPKTWGVLLRKSGEGSVNPFQGMQKGDWSSPEFRWNLNVFESGRGSINGAGVDSTEREEGLSDVLKIILGKQPVTLLVAEPDLPRIQGAAATAGITLDVREVPQRLSTSGNPAPAVLGHP